MRKKEIKFRIDGIWFDLDDRGIPDKADAVVIKEKLTLKEFKKHFPDKYKELIKKTV
jgi:hypothetical protein